MKDEKCCCNCLHCARWRTSKGIECHCDLTNRYLSYFDMMDTYNDCCRWEKETKWDLEKEHDKEIYNQALDDGIAKIEEMLSRVFNDDDDYYLGIENGYQDCIRELEQLKGE